MPCFDSRVDGAEASVATWRFETRGGWVWSLILVWGSGWVGEGVGILRGESWERTGGFSGADPLRRKPIGVVYHPHLLILLLLHHLLHLL